LRCLRFAIRQASCRYCQPDCARCDYCDAAALITILAATPNSHYSAGRARRASAPFRHAAISLITPVRHDTLLFSPFYIDIFINDWLSQAIELSLMRSHITLAGFSPLPD